MERLRVTSERQLPDSVECGLVCLKMIYAYYGIEISMDRLRQDLALTDVGTYAPQLGSHLLKNGFDVEIVTYNPRLVWKQDKNLTSEQLKAKFEDRMQSADQNDKFVLEYFVNFMNNGGSVKVKIPSIEELDEETKAGRPVIVFLTNAVLYDKNIADLKGRPFSYTFHTDVVTGVMDGKVAVNDPYFEEEGGEKEYPVDEFMFAVHSSSLGDLDNGCFIKIRKRD